MPRCCLDAPDVAHVGWTSRTRRSRVGRGRAATMPTIPAPSSAIEAGSGIVEIGRPVNATSSTTIQRLLLWSASDMDNDDPVHDPERDGHPGVPTGSSLPVRVNCVPPIVTCVGWKTPPQRQLLSPMRTCEVVTASPRPHHRQTSRRRPRDQPRSRHRGARARRRSALGVGGQRPGRHGTELVNAGIFAARRGAARLPHHREGGRHSSARRRRRPEGAARHDSRAPLRHVNVSEPRRACRACEKCIALTTSSGGYMPIRHLDVMSTRRSYPARGRASRARPSAHAGMPTARPTSTTSRADWAIDGSSACRVPMP